VGQASPFEDVRIWKDADDPGELLERTIADLGIRAGRVLVDDTMWATFLLALKEALPRADFGLASQVMVPLRLRKTSDEIDHMAQAGTIADEAFEKVLQLKVSGMSELELASSLEEAMREKGAEKVAFETLVASGSNGALPHHRAGKRTIEPGDAVILDFGCRRHGYCSDMTRTICCGEPSTEIQAVYEIVERAQEKAVQAAKPGVEAQTIDRIAREEISRAGHGDQFIHRTGHGIGLDVHEAPYIVEGNDLVLHEGMAFSVEPGVYIPGRFGIRIEDVVVVTETGTRAMTSSIRALQVVH
jgi:Xaa-Pro aminopeptidase